MVEVKFYETATARKKGEVFGVFNIPINPEEVPATSEKLKGKFTTSGKDMYELAEACRTKRVEKAVFECKEQAIDRVRAYIPKSGVLVATIVVPEDKTEKTTEETTSKK